MKTLKDILLSAYSSYPLIQMEDMIKLIYQNEFGGGHLISNPINSLDYLCREYDAITTPLTHRFESIGNDLYRLYLEDIKNDGITLDTVNQFFVHTSHQVQGTSKGFEAKLELFISLCEESLLPFSIDNIINYLAEYKVLGYPPVSHSQIYREAYAPHYRIVHSNYKNFYEIFCSIDRLLNLETNAPITIAIDGNSGSGKSSLAHILTSIYDCNVFHMDDFFLSTDQKTPERLHEPGGNVDYERFYKEVMLPLTKGTPFDYQLFDCRQGKLADFVSVSPKKLNIIEGVYSLHPTYHTMYDLKIFLYTPPEIQCERILNRNGEYMLSRFQQEWIPLENHYFTALDIPSLCEHVIDTSFPH